MRIRKYGLLAILSVLIVFTFTACGKPTTPTEVENTSEVQKDPKDMTKEEYVAYLESKGIKTDNTILGTFYGCDFKDGVSLSHLIENGNNYNAVVEDSQVNLRFGEQDISNGDEAYAEYSLYDCKKKLGLVSISEYGDHNVSQYVIERIGTVDEDINWRGCTGGCSMEQFISVCGESADTETPYDNVTYLVYLTDTHYIKFKFVDDSLQAVRSYLIDE